MARPDGKSVYVTLPADRKRRPLLLQRAAFFCAFKLKEQILSLGCSDFIPFYDKTISDFIPFMNIVKCLFVKSRLV